MADLDSLGELCAWMRTVGATHARVGDVELTLGPVAVVDVAGTAAANVDDPQDREREELETLLHSSGADASMFIRARRS